MTKRPSDAARRGVVTSERDREQGVTLIELTVTIAIIGVAFVSLLAALTGVFMDGDTQRKSVQVETLMRRYAEQLQAATYVSCATTSTAGYTSTLAPVPANYTASIVSVEYWNADSSATFNTTCAGGDKGAQRITIRVASTDTVRPVRDDLVLVKDNPS
jgi:prepilin-type N-terminal cleavage/methylation domain-containing protein